MTDEKKESKGGTKDRDQAKLDAANEERTGGNGPKKDRAPYPRSLRDDVPWKEFYPGLPTVEAARQQEDPVFWAKADDFSCEYVDNQRREELLCSFFLAGYSIDGLPPPSKGPGGESFDIVTLGQFLRGHDRRFYGLTVYPRDGKMDWKEISDRCLEYEGPGWLEVRLDAAWEPRRYSEVLKQYPGCKLPPSVDAFKDTKFKGLDEEEFARILVEGYRTKVVITDVGTVKERYRSGEIREIVCVVPGERFLHAVAAAAWSSSIVEDFRLSMAEPSVSVATSRGLEPSVTAADDVLWMARCGELLLLHDRERCETLPSEWKRFTLELEDLSDSHPCEAIFEPPLCYIHPFRGEVGF